MADKSEGNGLSGSEQTASKSDEKFLVVGLGASAGGIKAFKEFFSNVPADSGMAYVVILHLSPRHESKLAEILQVTSPIPVTQVNESVKIEPNHVYVIPPNKSLSMNDGTLTLSEINRIEERRAPVDIFFRTLAQSKQSRAVSVILSGTGANGSMGIKQIKELGGISIVQDPAEAEYSDMPRNSLATGLVDYILPVASIPAKIIAYKEHLGTVRLPEETPEPSPTDEQALREIFAILRAHTKHDFSNYKRATVLRRVERRINLHELPDLQSYARFLREHKDESKGLLKDLLISVTHFFRDTDSFGSIETSVIPKIFEGKTSQHQVRVWVAGCATGEEAYSVAMMIAEQSAALSNGPTVQIFASDIDEQAVATARDGFYTATDIADVSPERLNRFFVKEKNGYRVRRELREMVLFAAHNIIKDPPFSHLDLVSCRNLLIYLNRVAQRRVLEVIHFALRPAGFLFLGSSESVNGVADLFATIDKAPHIFQSRAMPSHLAPPIADVSPGVRFEPRQYEPGSHEGRVHERLSFIELHQRLLEHYGPPSVLINEEYDVIHLSDQAGQYLQVKGGEPSNNLLKLVLPELRLDLRTALYQAVQNRTDVEARGLQVRAAERTQVLNLIVRPVLRPDDPARGFILVLFEESTEQSPVRAEAVQGAGPAARQLEEELIRVKAQLRSAVEQYETQTEELKASNEELQAMNEELRSAAEELETGKEELQSVNEELSTVNQELKIKIEELSQANNDLLNLMSSTEIGTIFLDRTLSIKLFTPRAREIFNLIPADLGRPLVDITSKSADANLLKDAERVLDRLETVEREFQTQGNGDRWYLMRLLPYRTKEDRIAGVVMTFLDITSRKQAEEGLRESEERLRLVLESLRDYAIFTLTPDNLVNSWNAGAERLFGYTEAEILGKPGSILFTPEDRAGGVPEHELDTALRDGRAADERWHIRRDGSRFYVSGMMCPLRDRELRGYVKIARDLTEQRQAQEELRDAHDELETRVHERTGELESANELLRTEVIERGAAEERARGLLRRIVTAQEDERRRVARDLHDHLGQQLTVLRLKLESHKQRFDADSAATSQVEEIQSIARQIDSDVDFLAWELRPSALDDLGLSAALANYVREWSVHYDVPAEFHSSGAALGRISSEIETTLYRIAQEALNNIVKHARAGRVDVILERRDYHAVLIIEDNGLGFDPDDKATVSKGLGLMGMRERAALAGGTVEVESSPSRGTTIFARLPIAQAAEGGRTA